MEQKNRGILDFLKNEGSQNENSSNEEQNSSIVENTLGIISELKQKIENIPLSVEDVAALQNKVAELKKQNKSLKHLLEIEQKEKAVLRKKILEAAGKIGDNEAAGISSNQNKSDVSRLKIEEFVDKMLEDENVNIKYLPDFVEKKIYINVFNLVLGLLDNLMDSTKIEFMGHHIKLDLQSSDKIEK